MRDKIKLAAQVVWFVAGCTVLFFVLEIGANVISTMKEIKELLADVTITDVRQIMNITEKQIDKDLFEVMTFRGYVTDELIQWTPENWGAFLDFCDNTGYIVTEDNWKRYIHGELNEKP